MASRHIAQQIVDEWEFGLLDAESAQLLDLIEAALLAERERAAQIADYRGAAHKAQIKELGKRRGVVFFEVCGRNDEDEIIASRIRGESYEELSASTTREEGEKLKDFKMSVRPAYVWLTPENPTGAWPLPSQADENTPDGEWVRVWITPSNPSGREWRPREKPSREEGEK